MDRAAPALRDKRYWALARPIRRASLLVEVAMRTRVLGLLVLILVKSGGVRADDSRCNGPCVHPPGAPIKAAPGAEVVAIAAPTWCTNQPPKKPEDEDGEHARLLDDQIEEGVKRGDIPERMQGKTTDDTAREVVRLSCLDPSDPNLAKHAASWRQAMVNLMGMTAAENAAYLRLVSSLDRDKLAKKTEALCKRLADAKPSSAEDTVRIAARRWVLDCDNASKDDDETGDERSARKETEEAAWSMAGRQAKLPGQLVTVAAVAKCLHAEPKLPEKEFVMKSAYAATFVTCVHDLKTLDKASLLAELQADKVDPVEQLRALEAFGMVRRFAAQVTGIYANAAKKHPELVTILDKAPERGFSDWVTQAAAWKGPLDAATGYEARFYAVQTSKSAVVKAFAGCGAPTRKNFFDYLRSKKPKTAAQVRAIGRDSIGDTLGLAMVACDAAEGRGFAAEAMHDLMLADSPAPGPRSAAFTAAERALAEVESDQSNFPFKLSGFEPDRLDTRKGKDFAEVVFDRLKTDQDRFRPLGTWTDVDKAGDDDGRESDGEILRVTKGKGGVVVSFKTVYWMEAMHICVDARPRRVDYVEHENGDSVVHYVQTCSPAASEKRSSTLASVVIPEVLAVGLRPGLFARVRASDVETWREKGTRPGFVVEAYADKARKTLVYAVGAKL